MTTLYFILTAFLSSVTTLIAPTLIMRIRQYKTRKQRKLTRMIREEVEKQLKEIVND